MDRVTPSLKDKIMTAEQAAKIIKSGDTIAVSGFTSVSYPKAVPKALSERKDVKDCTLIVGAAVGDEIDGALVRNGIIS